MLAVALIVTAASCAAHIPVPYLNFRPQGFDAARELVGWQGQINKASTHASYATATISPAYYRSMRSRDIAKYLFCPAVQVKACDESCVAFQVQGTKVAGRSPYAILADYCYVPTDFESTIEVRPHIDSFVVDFNLFAGLDSCVTGLYFKLHAPVAHTRWDLHFCEGGIQPGTNDANPGYYGESSGGMARGSLLQDFESYVFSGSAPASSPAVTYEGLRYARMSPFRLTKTDLADMHLAVGWNFVLNDDYHGGIEVRGALPTGNRPEGVYLFEPIVGNGHHGELGAGLTAHALLWTDESCHQSLRFYLDARAMHLFATHQCRTFDLKGKPLSRYMLAAYMTPPAHGLVLSENGDAAQRAATAQFKGVYAPLANITTIPVNVDIAVQADVVCKFAYVRGNVEVDAGYNLWARSRENIRPARVCCCNRRMSDGTWSLKGDAFMFGFADPESDNPGVALSATQSKATTFSGTNNWPEGIDGVAWNQNPGIDEPKAYALDNDGNNLVTNGSQGEDGAWQRVSTSERPVLIRESDLDIEGASTRGMSSKFFINVNYTASWCTRYIPYIGCGFQVERGESGGRDYCSLSQWCFWVKVGTTIEGSGSCAA